MEEEYAAASAKLERLKDPDEVAERAFAKAKGELNGRSNSYIAWRNLYDCHNCLRADLRSGLDKLESARDRGVVFKPADAIAMTRVLRTGLQEVHSERVQLVHAWNALQQDDKGDYASLMQVAATSPGGRAMCTDMQALCLPVVEEDTRVARVEEWLAACHGGPEFTAEVAMAAERDRLNPGTGYAWCRNWHSLLSRLKTEADYMRTCLAQVGEMDERTPQDKVFLAVDQMKNAKTSLDERLGDIRDYWRMLQTDPSFLRYKVLAERCEAGRRELADMHKATLVITGESA